MYYFKNINSKCIFRFWNVYHFTYPIIQNHFTVFYWGCPFPFWCRCCQKVYSLSLNRRKSQKLTLLWKSAFETDNLRMAGNSPVQQWLAVVVFLQNNLLVWRRLLSQLVFRGLFCLRLGAPWYLLLLSHCWLTWHSTCVEDLHGPGVWTEVGRESLGHQLKTGKTCCRLYLIYDNHTSFCTTHQYSYTI